MGSITISIASTCTTCAVTLTESVLLKRLSMENTVTALYRVVHVYINAACQPSCYTAFVELGWFYVFSSIDKRFSIAISTIFHY